MKVRRERASDGAGGEGNEEGQGGERKARDSVRVVRRYSTRKERLKRGLNSLVGLEGGWSCVGNKEREEEGRPFLPRLLETFLPSNDHDRIFTGRTLRKQEGEGWSLGSANSRF